METTVYPTQANQMIVTLDDSAAVWIRKARQESSRGETIVCNTPEEMQQYFDSL